MKTRYTLLIMGLTLVAGCNPKEEHAPTPMTVYDSYFSAQHAFHQYRLITDALGLEPRDPDGVLAFTFGTDPSYVSINYPAPMLECPTPALYATTDPVPAGEYRIPFHLEFPMTVGQTLPEEILEVESVTLGGSFDFSLTLDPDFPFSKAVVEEAVFTLPAWVEENVPVFVIDHRMQWPYPPETIRPGQVNTFSVWCSNVYALKEGEGIHEPGHRLDLDGTISIDGILSVDENDRRNPQEASSPWAITFLSRLDERCQIWRTTGRMDFSRNLTDRTLTFSEIPAFLRDSETVLDLDDLYGEVKVQNRSSLPFSVTGAFEGDDRKFPFSLPAVGSEETLRALVSEKGGRTAGNTDDRLCDIRVEGFSGLIDENPVSFAMKDVRIANDTEKPSRFVFDWDHEVIVQGEVSSPLMIGKDFRVRLPLEVSLLVTAREKISRLTGSFSVENTLPFDFEVRPVFQDLMHQDLSIPVSGTPIRFSAGGAGSPRTERFTFDWTVDAPVRYLVLEFIGTTGKDRQGETLHKDQGLAVKDMAFEIY